METCAFALKQNDVINDTAIAISCREVNLCFMMILFNGEEFNELIKKLFRVFRCIVIEIELNAKIISYLHCT